MTRRTLPSRLLICLLAVVGGFAVKAQLVPLTPIVGEEDMTWRLLLRNRGASGVHAAMQPLTYADAATLLRDNDSSTTALTWADAANAERARVRLGLVAREGAVAAGARGGVRGWLGRNFYETKGYALDVDRPGLRLLVNPVLDLRTGRQSNGGGYNFLSTRGIRLASEVDNKVWFQTAIYENQEGLKSWEEEWRRAYNNQVPGVGFFKDFDPILYDLPRAVDYFQATGEVGFKLTKHIQARVGHGNPLLGVGERSLLLGAFADPFLYAQIDTRIWKLHYRNLYTQLQDGTQSATRIERKFMVAHTLSIQITRTWEFGLTEQTVVKRENGFDAQYLNPVILYRAVEQDNGSPDNALIGFHTNVILGRSAMVYGQFLLDEFKFDELFLNGDKWWANKYSWQLGGRWYDAFELAGLNLQAELNYVRPFTYGHYFEGRAYTHYNQPLAHPWGASLREVMLSADQWLTPRWRLSAKLDYLQQDEILGPFSEHIGANILINNDERGREYGYTIAGTAPVERTHVAGALKYLPFPGAQLEARYELYARRPFEGETIVQHGVSLGLSLNAWRRERLF